MVEYGYDFVSGGIAKDVIGHGYEKHVPLLATLFFFILISNFVGLIPGCKTPTGSLSITWALAAVSFVYFIYWGIKAQGLGGYLKSFAPSGLPVPMIPIVWFLELFSTVLRVLTLAVRLYGNMFAGHMVLGIFALLTSLFIGSAIDGAGLLAGGSLHRLDRVFAVHVRAGSAGRLPAGVRVHHPVGGVHLAGHLRATRLRARLAARTGVRRRLDAGRGFGHARDVGFHRRGRRMNIVDRRFLGQAQKR